VKSITLVLLTICMGSAALFAQPVVTPGGVSNAAGVASSTSIAPGSLVSIYGSNLAAALTQASTVPLSTTLGSTSVTFNNIPAPLLFVAGGQINAQVPWEVSGSSAQVVVTNAGANSAAVTATLAPAVPGIFAYNNTMAIAYGNSDYLFAWPTGSVAGLTTHAAKINDPTTLVILATGLGPVNPAVATGGVPTDGGLHPTTTTPTVTVGGVAAQVVFSGMSPYVGVYQLNIVIQPGTPTGDAIPVVITMNGVKSNAPVIAVTN
jgi:uncharacterized protein (TIGR03437 family)